MSARPISASIGVLVMAHGTPGSIEEIEPFYTRIRRGSPPPPELLADLLRRYEAIGGISPLAERTRAQVDALARALDASAPGRYLVGYGAKYTAPLIEEGAATLAASGVTMVVGLVLTPHRSARGSEEYLDRAQAALAQQQPVPRFVGVEDWHDAPGFADLLGRRVVAALSGMEKPVVLFTAHSVPEQVAEPYRSQVLHSAEQAADAARLGARSIPWRVAFQSAGRTNQRWVGPDLLTEIDQLAAAGARSVVCCPIGFVSDHLEVLYDLDIEAAARAAAAGLAFARTASLNDDPALASILAAVVEAAAGAAG